MDSKKKRAIFFIVLLLIVFLSYKLLNSYVHENKITGMPAVGGEESFEFTDVPTIEKTPGVTIDPDGGLNAAQHAGKNRILNPTDTRLTSLKTNSGIIKDALLENHALDFGDLVQGKISSFTDNNLISIKSMFDPDTRIEITMIKDGWAKVEQYDNSLWFTF